MQQGSMEHDSNDNEEISLLLSLCNSLANNKLEQIIKLYLKFKDNTSNSKIYSKQQKLKILQLYYENSETYKVLQSTLCLPPVSTLTTYIKSTQDGINEALITTLQAKIALMEFGHRHGILCVNIMQIKPHIHYDSDSDNVTGISSTVNYIGPAQYAIVVMVRGIATSWHQVVAVSLLATLNAVKEFNKWIDKLITKLSHEALINIVAIVSGTDNFLINAFELRNIQRLKPYFMLYMHKIYYFFDPLHSMLLLYNEMKSNPDIYYVAKWEHISKFYELDSTRNFRLSNSSCTINADDLEQNKLKLAAHILSMRTSTGLSTFANLRILDQDAKQTADFLLKINKIFASLHPNAIQPEYVNMLTNEENCSEKSNKSFLQYLHNKSRRSEQKSKVKFVECLSTSIFSVTLMQEERSYSDHASILTQYLNLDPLMQTIDKLSLKHPTMPEFFEIIKEELILNNLQSNESNTNMDSFIESASKIFETQNCNTVLTELTDKTLNKQNMESYNEDYRELEYDHATSIFYVATYLLDKSYKKFKNSVSSRMKFLNSSVYYETREQGCSGSVLVPDNDFLQFVYNIDVVFVDYCKEAMASGKFFEQMMKHMSKFIVTIPSERGPLEYIIGLFVNLRIYHIIKYNNEQYEKNHNDTAEISVSRLNIQGVNLTITKSFF